MIKITDSNRSSSAADVERSRQAFKSLLSNQDLGFFQLPDREENWKSVATVAEQLKSKFIDFVFIGIGGSGLGGKTVRNSCPHLEASDHLYFLENVDKYSVDSVLRKVNLEKTAFVVVSKTGSTLETLAITNHIGSRLAEDTRPLSFEGRTIVITEKKSSPLHDWGESIGADILEIPMDVGGRFSVLTPVGLLPAALLGMDLSEMREGSRWALSQTELISELSAQILQSFERKEWITQFWIYSDRLSTFGGWLQQLWAESLAKKVDRSGGAPQRISTPMSCTGSNDQHSLLQQAMEGDKDKLMIFLRILGESDPSVSNLFETQEHLKGNGLQKILDAETTATREALAEAGASVLEISMEELNPRSFAALFMTFQLLIGTLGEVLNIDAFNQPGVEAGKVIAKKMLS